MRNCFTEREIRLESPTALRRIVGRGCRAAQIVKKQEETTIRNI